MSVLNGAGATRSTGSIVARNGGAVVRMTAIRSPRRNTLRHGPGLATMSAVIDEGIAVAPASAASEFVGKSPDTEFTIAIIMATLVY